MNDSSEKPQIDDATRLQFVRLANALNMPGKSWSPRDVVNKAIERLGAGHILAMRVRTAGEEYMLR